MHTRGPVTLAALAALVALTGCSGGAPDKASSPTTASTVAPSAPTSTTVTTRATTTTAQPTTTTQPTAPPGTSRQNPVPIGTTMSLADRPNGDIDITVNGYTPNADEMLAAASESNGPAAPGSRYVLVNVTATYHAGELVDTGRLFGSVKFAVFAKSAKEIVPGSCQDIAVVPDKLDIAGELLDGGTVSGNLCFRLSEDDAAGPVLFRAQRYLCAGSCPTAWYDVHASGGSNGGV